MKPSPRVFVCESVCAPIGQGAWSETVSEELYQTWSHNRDSMKISSCYYGTQSWCGLCCYTSLMHRMNIITCMSRTHRNTPACSKNTLSVVARFNTITIALQTRRGMCGTLRRFCRFHCVADSAREPQPLICVYLLSALFVRHLNLMNSCL